MIAAASKPSPAPAGAGQVKTLVIYHADCPDGFGAAWAASLRLGRGSDVAYHPVKHGEAPPSCDGLEVYILDFSYPREVLIAMEAAAASLLVLDHHATARDALAGLPFARFDMTRSGAGMAWDHFMRYPRPDLIRYVEAGDLWDWRASQSREIHAYICAQVQTFSRWDELRYETGLDMAFRGWPIRCATLRRIEATARRARRVELFGERFPAVQNTDDTITSELLNRLAEGEDFAAGWSFVDSGRVRFSLRSTRGGADVSEIAQRFGGGGHKHAAGFSIPVYPRLLSQLLPARKAEEVPS